MCTQNQCTVQMFIKPVYCTGEECTGDRHYKWEEYHTDGHYKWEECTGDRHYKWEECTDIIHTKLYCTGVH